MAAAPGGSSRPLLTLWAPHLSCFQESSPCLTLFTTYPSDQPILLLIIHNTTIYLQLHLGFRIVGCCPIPTYLSYSELVLSHLYRPSILRRPFYPLRPQLHTMGSHNLPSPPAEEAKAALSRKSTSSSTKSTKLAHRISKRAGSTGNAAHAHHHEQVTQGAGMDSRHKRVWKACERCRMKKTKVRLALIRLVTGC